MVAANFNFSKTMKIVIFGGKGFIGKVLQEKAKESHKIAVFDLTKGKLR